MRQRRTPQTAVSSDRHSPARSDLHFAKYDFTSFDAVPARSPQYWLSSSLPSGWVNLQEKTVNKVLGIVLALVGLVALLVSSPARAATDLDVGKKVFAANCASCHLGGKNVVMSQKTLRVDALEKYLEHFGSAHDVGAIAHQVENGKNAMPAFSSRLSDDEIESVSAFVLTQAEAGW
ncbi:MAG: c-type cytochrome [Cyanobacteria bacterium J06648_11]